MTPANSTTGCYYPDGSPADGYQDTTALYPCSSRDSQEPPRPCCELEDPCMAENLCGRKDKIDGKVISIYRGGCTDPSWGSLHCPAKCTIGTDPYFDPLNDTVEINRCPSSSPHIDVLLFCNDDAFSVNACSLDGQSIVYQGDHPKPWQQAWFMNAEDVNTPVGYAGTHPLDNNSTAASWQAANSTGSTTDDDLLNSRLVKEVTIPLSLMAFFILLSGLIAYLLRRSGLKTLPEDTENPPLRTRPNHKFRWSFWPKGGLSSTVTTSPPLRPPPPPPSSPTVTHANPALVELNDDNLPSFSSSSSDRARPADRDRPPTPITPWPRWIVSPRAFPTSRRPANPSSSSYSRRNSTLPHSHTLPDIVPLSPFILLSDGQYYFPPATSADDRGRRDSRLMRRSVTAPNAAVWQSHHPNPLGSNPTFSDADRDLREDGKN
ncbi:hypothetical protein QBC42DRAFT_327923 [Cladorrhinum samala]|uniref:Uncharacterized protein n=1 Tax=Cladorrhinum samala TaxID=585594 RepID=A0AAV9HZS1_9PEZI|nr:hypothetical protein QBC42DRAFT_327923 [Cladorrhinum samala]